MEKIKIVAEIGCNHNGDKQLAKKMVDVAKACGVDAVKFQAFKAEELISKYAPKADYQKATTGNEENQLDMTKRLQLSYQDIAELTQYAKSLDLDSFSTPFDFDSIDALIDFGQTTWKIPSGEITNLPYLRKIGSLKCPNKKIILSTGMTTMDEIRYAYNQLVDSGTDEKSIIVLHCNTEYPTPDEDVNLLAIKDLIKNFPNSKIGFSDHSKGYAAAIGSAMLGITLIEKHFTLDKNLPGPDQKASASPEEMKELCENVRRIETMLGDPTKQVTPSERKNISIARKSIVAKVDIKKGETFTEENITCKRPGNGISPVYWYELIGKVAQRDFESDELIQASGFYWEENNV